MTSQIDYYAKDGGQQCSFCHDPLRRQFLRSLSYEVQIHNVGLYSYYESVCDLGVI